MTRCPSVYNYKGKKCRCYLEVGHKGPHVDNVFITKRGGLQELEAVIWLNAGPLDKDDLLPPPAPATPGNSIFFDLENNNARLNWGEIERDKHLVIETEWQERLAKLPDLLDSEVTVNLGPIDLGLISSLWEPDVLKYAPLKSEPRIGGFYGTKSEYSASPSPKVVKARRRRAGTRLSQRLSHRRAGQAGIPPLG